MFLCAANSLDRLKSMNGESWSFIWFSKYRQASIPKIVFELISSPGQTDDR